MAEPSKILKESDRERLIQKLSAARKIGILSHVNPDGDAIGSMLGLFWFLKQMGKEVQMAIPNEIPDFLHWMEGADRIWVTGADPDNVPSWLSSADVLFCLDFNETNRLDVMQEPFLQSKAFKILIDHHPVPENSFDLTFSDVTVSSAAELVFDFMNLPEHQAVIDKVIAECIFTGIMTDTGCFSYSSSEPETWHTVAALLKTGIDKDKVYNLVYEKFSYQRMQLMGHALKNKLKIVPGVPAATISITKTELERYNFKTGDTEGFVNLPFSIKGIKVSALFVEKEDHIKISLRSRGKFAINEFSKLYFGGGGHLNAAGGEYYGSMQEALNEFISRIKEHEAEISSS